MESEEVIPKDLPHISGRVIAIVAVVMVVVAVVLLLVGYLPMRAQKQRLAAEANEAKNHDPVVEVVHPRRMQDDLVVSLPGDVHPVRQTAIYARVNGYLRRWWADIGDHVEEGELLAEIDAPEVDADLNQARAALEQARANVLKSRDDLDLAQATLKRYQGLIPTHSVTQQQLDEKQSAANDAASAFASANAAVKSSEAAIQHLEAQQGFERVVAPFDGVVTSRNYDVGALISPTDTAPNHELFTIAAVNTLRVYVNLPQAYATLVQPGDRVNLEVRNYPGINFPGSVSRNTGSIDPNTRTLKTELDFDNDTGKLIPGMYGQVKLMIHRSHPALTVPTSAIMFESNGSQVATVVDDAVHFRQVGLGRDYGTEIEITTGLDGTEQIISTPGEQLVEGIKVKLGSSGTATRPSPQAAENTEAKQPRDQRLASTDQPQNKSN